MSLLIIDLHDERFGMKRRFDHLHAWGTNPEMCELKWVLDEQFGSHHNHIVISNSETCPICGASPLSSIKEDRPMETYRPYAGGSEP